MVCPRRRFRSCSSIRRARSGGHRGTEPFRHCKIAPADAWRSVWAGVLHWLVPGQKFSELKWTPAVRPTYGPDEALPADVEPARSPPRAGLVSSLQAHAAASRIAEIDQLTGRLPVPPPDSPDGTVHKASAKRSLPRFKATGASGRARRAAAIATVNRRWACPGGQPLGDARSRAGRAERVGLLVLQIRRTSAMGDPNHGAYGLIAWSLGSPANYGDDKPG